jgi:mRNA-degrading endonuclease YafQ of YafQ-DinJ toxin-antitoxin module
MKYRYRAAEAFWKSFYALSPEQKESARTAWLLFREDPFDPRLRTHKIHRLSSALNKTVHAVVIESDLLVVFFIEGDTVFTFGIGSHDIYKR